VEHDLEQVLGDLAGDGLGLDEVDNAAKLGGGNRSLFNVFADFVQGAQQVVDDPVGGNLAVTPLGHGFEIIGNRLFRDEYRSIVDGQAEFAHEALLLVVGQFRQITAKFLDEGVIELERQKVRVGEIAI